MNSERMSEQWQQMNNDLFVRIDNGGVYAESIYSKMNT